MALEAPGVCLRSNRESSYGREMEQKGRNRKRFTADPYQVAASSSLPDGRLAEMILDTEGRSAFLVADGEKVERLEQVTTTGGKLRPFSPQNSLLVHRVILLPSAAEEYGSQVELLDRVRHFLHRYIDVSEGFEELAAHYVLLSWVYDAFEVIPYLRFKGDFGVGKSRCLTVVGSVCYRPMFASGASTVSPLFRIIDSFRGTLVLDEGDFRFSDEKAELVKILNNGNASGFPVLRSEITPEKEFNPRAFTVFGPKVLATRHLFEDKALESRCLTEVMQGLPLRPDVPLTLPESFEIEARHLRNQLLSFRFRSLASFRGNKPSAIPGCEPRISQVYAPLTALAASPEARERIEEAARRTSGTLRADRDASLEAQLVGIIYELSRTPEPVAIKAVAEKFAERLGGDYLRPITPRWIGSQLRNRLSLSPKKQHGTFILGPENAERLRALYLRYGVGDVGDVGDIDGEARQDLLP